MADFIESAEAKAEKENQSSENKSNQLQEKKKGGWKTVDKDSVESGVVIQSVAGGADLDSDRPTPGGEENLDGEPMDEDLDGVPMSDSDDGEPMEEDVDDVGTSEMITDRDEVSNLFEFEKREQAAVSVENKTRAVDIFAESDEE
jgi:hypothetical protein